MALVFRGSVGAHELLRFKTGASPSTRKALRFNHSPRNAPVLSLKSRSQLHFSSPAALPPLEVLAAGYEMMSSSEVAGSEDVNASYAKGSVGVVEAMTGKTIEEGSNVVVDRGIGGDGVAGGGDGGGGDGNGGDGGSEPEPSKRWSKALSMSQKLTLAYAALVGVGGLIGFLKSGSTKSLFSGGITALALLFVHTNLPVNPVGASSVGAAVSLLLLFVMGSRFVRSGKVFPAGVVSLVSLIMTGGYVHGIMRSSH